MNKLLKTLLIFFVFSVFALLIAIGGINTALKNEKVRSNLLQTVASTLHGELYTDQLAIYFSKKSINITSSDLKGSLFDNALSINLPETTIKISYGKLLQGSLFPSTLITTSPQISYVSKNAEEQEKAPLNWGREFNALLKKMAGKGTFIQIHNGIIQLNNTTLSNLEVKTIPENSVTSVNLSTDIHYKNSIIPLVVKGYTNNSLTRGNSSFTIKAKSIPFDLIPKARDFFFSGGTADFSGTLASQRTGVSLKGKFDVRDMLMTVGWTSQDKTRHQEKKYDVKKCSLAFLADLNGRKINFSALDLQSDDFHIQGSLILDFTSIINPFMDLRFVTDEMEVTTLKQLLPDPLINDWTTRTIFPRLENGTAQITNFTLAGTIDEISGLSEPENNHCLAWSGILKNVDSFYNNHKPLGRVHTAELAMDGDLLTINNVSGKSGKSLLTRANVSISSLYSDISQLTTEIEGSFDIAWLTKIFSSGVAGEELRQMTAPVVSVSGQVDGSVDFSLELLSDDVSLKKLSGRGAASGPLDLQITQLLPLHLKKTNYTLEYPGRCTISGKGLWGNSPFNGQLNLIDLDRKQNFALSIKADVSEIQTLLPEKTLLKDLMPCVGSIPVVADIVIENKNINATGSIDFSRLRIFEDKKSCQEVAAANALVKGSFDIKYGPQLITVHKITLKTETGNLAVQGKFKTTQENKDCIEDINLQATSFPVNSASIIFPEKTAFLASGILDADIKTTSPVDTHNWASFLGSFTLDGWHGSLSNPAVTVDNVNIQGNFADGVFHLKGNDMLFAKFNTEYPLSFSADLTKKDLWKGTLRIYGDFFDLSSSPSLFKEGKTDFKQDFPFDSLDIFAEIGHVRYKNLIFSPLLLKGQITKNRIIISNILLEHAHDLLWLTGYLSGDEVIYDSYFTIRDTDVNPFMALLGFESKSITGSLDIEGKLTARVIPGATIFETSKGPISFEVKEGSLVSSSPFIKILDLISLENIFDKKDVLKWKNRFKFNIIQGRLDLADGIFTTDSFVMDASAFDIFAQGKINGLKNTLDMEVKIAPFGTINKIIRSIPFLGFVLTGKSKSLFDYSLLVKGDLENPDVSYIPLKDTFKSLTGYIKRLLIGREGVQKEINSQLKEDMQRKNEFILLMKKTLAPLHGEQQK
ncbi:MAG: hypothetical protein DSY70_09360 [Desulfobulbus sp.]|nr:MAG: hypothetical protein DSY70_09360 [Desulfobulbus sp.]